MNQLRMLIGLVTFVSSISLQAADAKREPSIDAQFAAARLEQIFARALSDEDFIRSLPLGVNDEAQVRKAFKEAGAFTKPHVRQPAPGLVALAVDGHSVVVNFNGIENGRITVNNRAIALTAEKNFLSYRSELVEAMTAHSTAAFFLMIGPTANAQTPQPWYSRTATALADFFDYMRPGGGGGIAVMSEPVVSRRLAVDLITALKNDDSYFQNQASHYGPDAKDAFAPIWFSCKQGQLDKVGHLGLDAHKNRVFTDGLERNGRSSYSFKETARGPISQIDSHFVVTVPSGALKHGENLLSAMDSYYGRFPEIAEECCATVGCNDQVQAGVQPILSHVGKALPSNTSVQ